MATDSLGSLVVSLSAETAKFTSALEKSAYEMNRTMGAMVASTKQLEAALLKLDAATGAFGISLRGLFGIVAVGAFAKLATSAIDAQAELSRLADRAGTTVEQLSSMRVAAHSGGVGMDEVALATTRLSKAIFEGQDGTTKAAQALQLLGLSAKDLAKLPTAQALQTVAGALDQFKESTGKTAVEMEILGKSGPKMGAFLKALAEDGTVAASVTTQMGDAARETEAKMFKLRDTFDSLETAAANRLLPAINAIAEAFDELQKTNANSIGVWDLLAESLRVVALTLITLYVGARENIVALHALGQALHVDVTSGNAAAQIKKIFDDSDLSINKMEVSLHRVFDMLEKGSPFLSWIRGDNAGRSAMYVGDEYYHGSKPGGGGKRTIGNLPGAGGADDPAKALLARQIAELDAYVAQEKQVLGARDEFLKVYYSQGYLSEKQYYDTRMQVMLDSLNVEVNTYTTEIEAIDAYIAKLGKRKDAEKQTEEALKQRAEIEGKITKTQIEASKNIGLFNLESAAAQERYLVSLRAINAELLALQGHTAAAAAITRADAEIQQRRALAIAGDTAALAQQDEIDRIKAAQDQLTEAATKYGYTIQQIGINQAIVDLQVQAGNITELQGFIQRADAARAMIPILNAQAAAYEAIAKASGDPKFLLQAQQIRLEIAKLAVDADALAKKFQDIFSGSFTTFLTDIIGHTKSVKQAFLDMGKSIEQQISAIAAKNISESLFGKGGAFGGLGGAFANLFGDKGASGGAIAANSALMAVAASASAAAAALASVATSSVASQFGGGSAPLGDVLSLLGDVPFFASGTPFVPKDTLAFIHKGEAIIPAVQNKAGGMGAIHIYNTVMPGATRESAEQAAAANVRAFQRAKRVT